MLSQAQRKYLINLQQKKFRQEQEVFAVEGEKIVRELLQSSFEVKSLYGTKSGLDNLGILANKSLAVYEISESDLQRISQLKTPNKVLAIANMPLPPELPQPSIGRPIIALDSIQDPGNMGTIVRTADWFGICNVVCNHTTVDIYNPKVIQASMGSFLRVKVHYTNLEAYLRSNVANTCILGAFPDGSDVFTEPVPESTILVIGNESNGISQKLSPFLHKRIAIPGAKHKRGFTGAESLNASVAAAILMVWATGNHLAGSR